MLNQCLNNYLVHSDVLMIQWVAYKKNIINLSELLKDEVIDSCISSKAVQGTCLSNLNKISQSIDRSSATLFVETLHEKTFQDAEFIAETDPAWENLSEVLLCYPGVQAMVYHRIANFLYLQNEWLAARIIAEHSHSLNGIDIHPGATIGSHIAIDHGTWIVIGETAIIGDHVRLYHNVSLGNLSVKKKQEWSKRHPTIEDHVTVYAWAIILGGETIIGHHSTIWWWAVVTSSVEPHSLVTTEFTTKYYDKRDRSEYENKQVSDR